MAALNKNLVTISVPSTSLRLDRRRRGTATKVYGNTRRASSKFPSARLPRKGIDGHVGSIPPKTTCALRRPSETKAQEDFLSIRVFDMLGRSPHCESECLVPPSSHRFGFSISVAARRHAQNWRMHMAGHVYETGRLNLPFVGICTFGKYPYVEDWDAIDADVAVMGAPFDFGCQWRSGARMGPRGIREASTLFSFGHGGAYDHEDDVTYLDPAKVRIVDLGDADIIHTDTLGSHANIEFGVRKMLEAGALPVVLGGDHSVNIPCINAFDGQEPIHVVQIDAHLDFVDERHGVRFGHGNPMRRAAEKPYVTGLSQIGIRNVSSTARDGYVDARKMGSDIQSVRQLRKMGVDAMLTRIPEGANYYLTVDI